MEKEKFSRYLYAAKYLIFLLTYFVIDYDLILMLPSAFESTDYILYSHQYTFWNILTLLDANLSY